MKRIFLFLALSLGFFLLSPWIFQAKADHFTPLPTEFSYSEKNLDRYHSQYLITLERIDKWEPSLQEYFARRSISYLQKLQFYTYLYLAQKDAAFLSFNVHKCFIGSLDPLTKRVITYFFPDFAAFTPYETDRYSEELAKEIWPHYQARLEHEQTSSRFYPQCGGKPASPAIQAVAKWTPWAPPLPKAPPPDAHLEEQLALMNHARQNLTQKQTDLAYAWAGEKGMRRYWWEIANTYMKHSGTALGKTVFVRSVLMMGLSDAVLATFEGKYTYCIPRPAAADSSIHPLIHDPSSPSYPSGHAAQAGAAKYILSYFFPEAAQKWAKEAEEAAYSRIWAGVHTPQDAVQGEKLGQKAGEAVLELFIAGSDYPAEER